MEIDIQRISERGLHLEGTLEIDRTYLIEDSAYMLEAIRYDLNFLRERNKVKVAGKLKTTLMLSCVRCLEEYEMAIDSHFDVVLFPAAELDKVETAVKDDEVEYIFFESNKIDLARILSEQVNLSMPFNPVCDEDCRGLCTVCGANLNLGQCRCDHANSEVSLLFDKIKR
jgi:uncharacterized protein